MSHIFFTRMHPAGGFISQNQKTEKSNKLLLHEADMSPRGLVSKSHVNADCPMLNFSKNKFSIYDVIIYGLKLLH